MAATSNSNSLSTVGTPMTEYLLKVVLVGNTAVGKTSLLLRYTDDSFSESFIATIGVDFKIKTWDTGDGIAKMQLWDTAGQDRFKTIVSSFYRGADGLCVVFDVTDMESFQGVEQWLKEARHYGNEDCLVLLIGNKTDMTMARVVDHDTAQALADKLGLLYIETSAKNSTNVHQAFTSMANTLVERKKKMLHLNLSEPDSSLRRLNISSTTVRDGWCYGGSTC